MFCLFLLLTVTSCNLVTAQSTCSEYGVGEESECTSGFASLFHIDIIEGNTNIRPYGQRQSLFPEITFNCSGEVTKWIFAANWEGNSQTYTELQIWRRRRRRSDRNEYEKVGSTRVRVGGRSNTEIYEYVVDPPLAFEKGDILGYYQPNSGISQLDLYLEDSGRTSSIIKLPLDEEEDSKSESEQQTDIIDLDNGFIRGNEYPLIHVETDPPTCGCRFMTTERIKALVSITSASPGDKVQYPLQQVIFPNIKFTCSGWVTKWIMGATYSTGVQYPELQIWRPSGPISYQKLNGTIAKAAGEEASGIYEFIVDPPLPFQPDDILGVLQPSRQNSRLLVNYDSGGDLLNFYLPLNSTEANFSRLPTNVRVGGRPTGRAVPLVSVEIDRALTVTTAITHHTPASESQMSVVSQTPITPTLTSITSHTMSASPTPQITSMEVSSSAIGSGSFNEEVISIRIQVTQTSQKSVAATSSTGILVETQATSSVTSSLHFNTFPTSVGPASSLYFNTSPTSVDAAAPISSVYFDPPPTSVATAILTSYTSSIHSPTLAAAIPASSVYFDSSPIPSVSVASTQRLTFNVSLGVVCMLLVFICAIVIALVGVYLSQRKSETKNRNKMTRNDTHFNTNMTYVSASPTNDEHVYDEPDTHTPYQPRVKVMINTSPRAISAYAVTAIPNATIQTTTSFH